MWNPCALTPPLDLLQRQQLKVCVGWQASLLPSSGSVLVCYLVYWRTHIFKLSISCSRISRFFPVLSAYPSVYGPGKLQGYHNNPTGLDPVSTFPVASLGLTHCAGRGWAFQAPPAEGTVPRARLADSDSSKSSSGHLISLTWGLDFRAGPLPRFLPGHLLPPTILASSRGKP